MARSRTTEVIANDTTTSADATYPISSVVLKSMPNVYLRWKANEKGPVG